MNWTLVQTQWETNHLVIQPAQGSIWLEKVQGVFLYGALFRSNDQRGRATALLHSNPTSMILETHLWEQILRWFTVFFTLLSRQQVYRQLTATRLCSGATKHFCPLIHTSHCRLERLQFALESPRIQALSLRWPSTGYTTLPTIRHKPGRPLSRNQWPKIHKIQKTIRTISLPSRSDLASLAIVRNFKARLINPLMTFPHPASIRFLGQMVLVCFFRTAGTQTSFFCISRDLQIRHNLGMPKRIPTRRSTRSRSI